MKISKIIVILSLMAFGISPVQEVLAQELDRDIHYAGAMASFQRGEFAEASEAFERALACDPVPEAGKAMYLPYVHLAAAQYESKQFAVARAALVQSQVYGIASTTEEGTRLLDSYGGPIMKVALTPEEMRYASSYITGQHQNYSLTPQEADRIRSKVMRRCAVSSDITDNNLPWYFHYEYGLDLIEAGDSQRAVEVLSIGASKRKESGRDRRMYGMWFIDYLPYYQIAVAHSKLGDWESAYDAIRTSRNFNEFSPDSSDYDDFVELEQLIDSKLRENDT